jgi:hypothetical protein
MRPKALRSTKKKLFSWCLCGFLITAFSRNSAAHEMRPAYLELRQTSNETYDALWKVPARGEDKRLGLYVRLPEGCSNLTEPRAFFSGAAYTERWSFQRIEGLAGQTIRIAGLTATLTDALVRVERLDGSIQVIRVTSSAPSFVVAAAPRRMEVVRTYLVLGIERRMLRRCSITPGNHGPS